MKGHDLEVPSGWRKAPLGEQVTLEYGASLPVENRRDGNVVVLGSSGVIGRHNKALQQGPGIVVGRKGTVGSLTWVNGPYWPIDTTYFVKPLVEARLPWLFRALSLVGLNRLDSSTGVPGLNRNDAYPIPVLVPDLAEQACIAEVLDTLDEAIRGTECLISKLETMRSGVLSQLVFPWLGDSGEYPPDLMMASRSLLLGRGLLPAGWEWVRLETIAEVERGKFTYRPRNEPKLFGGSFPFIQTGDVVRALGREINTASQWLNEMGMRFSREFPAGTIAVTIAANIADTAILGIPMCFPDSVVGVVVRKPHNNRFVELCIRVAKLGLEARAPQSAQKNINLQDLRPLWIPLPPPERQERIAVAYEAHESRIRDEATRLEKLRGIKSGLTSDLLTGRVRTPPR